MDEVAILPDGITYNMADELVKTALVKEAGSPNGITDRPDLLPPDDVLKACSGNYIKSLEDVASGAIFWDKVGFSPGKLATVSDDPVGLLSPLRKKEKIVSINVEDQQGSANDLLKDSDRKEKIRQLLNMLQNPGRGWSEHMIREVWLYKEREWDLADPDLVAVVPGQYTDFVVREMIKGGHTSRIQEEKLRDFVKKNIVTHLVIFEWYRGFYSHHQKVHYEPHTTRADLDTRERFEKVTRNLALPAIMFDILKESHTAQDVVQGIAKYSEDGCFSSIRKALAGATDDPDDLAYDLERACGGLDFFSRMELRRRRRGGLIRIAGSAV